MPYIDDDEYESLQGQAPLTAKDREDRNLVDLSGLDQKLIAYAGVLTPTQIEEKTGVPAAEVAKRTIEVLNSIDYFTIEQMRAKQVLALNQLIAEALQRLPTASDKAAPAYMNATGGNIYRAIKELESMEIRAQANHSALESAYARRMVDIVTRAYDRQLGKLSAQYPEKDAQALAEEFHQTILQISREIDAEG